MRIAAVQMTSGPDRSLNLRQAHDLLREALERGAQLVAFPENFSLMTDHADDYVTGAETLTGVTVQTLQEWAAEYDVWILGGSIPLKSRSSKTPPKPQSKSQGKASSASPQPTSPRPKVTNTSLLIASDGEIAARYDKIHLFDASISKDRVYRESDDVAPGSKPVIADTELGMFGLSICYDLRFPELYRAYSAKDVPILFVPSAFTTVTGRAHWDVLTRARAIENQAYVIAPAQSGEHPGGRKTHGHTRIVDPWGRVIAERPSGPGVVWAELSNDELNRVRTEMPVLEHRRL